jgi:hypothetical protein
MNTGFYGFKGNEEFVSNNYNITTYDTSGWYVIPRRTKGLYIFSISGGAGGGGGARRPSSTNAFGGGGGGGGEIMYQYFPIQNFGGEGTALFIVIGAGGSGGAAATADSTNGNSGVSGSVNQIYIYGDNSIFRTQTRKLWYASDFAGFNGSGGTTTTGSAGTGNRFNSIGYNLTGLFSTPGDGVGGGLGSSISIYQFNLCGGAGGAGHTAGAAGTSGNIVIQPITAISQTVALDFAKNTTAYAGGVANSGVAPTNVDKQTFGLFSPGYGGAGGGAGTTTAATKGANGYRGSGGGGGGGSLNGFAAGAGGSGGNGYVAIKAIFN